MPTSVIDKPIFWIAFGLMEISLPMIIPNRRWAGVAMFMVACVFFAVAFDWLPSPQLPSTIPPLVWYAPSALIGAILLAVLSAFIQISQSRSSAQRIVAGLRDFGREWAGRFVGFPIGGYGIINAEQEAFNDQFKRELDQLNRELEARG